MRAGKHTRGFTLIELLVVIGIIGVLVAMLMPAVQQVREAARRTECLNQLKQLGIALQHYESSRKKLPPGWHMDESYVEPGWGWMSYTLPFIEQNNIYRKLDFESTVKLPEHQPLIAQTFSGQLCPSSTFDSPTFQLDIYDADGIIIGDIEVGRTHYVGCVGSSVPVQEMEDGEMCPSLQLMEGDGERLNGMFYENSHTRFSDILDGTAHTIMVGERSAELFDSTWVGVSEGTQYTAWRVVGWTGEPPNTKASSTNAHFHGFAQFNSEHPGGLTNFNFADGHTRTIHNHISRDVFFALGTIQGREFVTEYDY